jgi:hypothetical protein
LAAYRFALHDKGAQPLGGAVDGRREPRRSSTHDQQVEPPPAQRAVDADGVGEVGVRGVFYHLTVVKHRDREFGGALAEPGK